MDVQLEISRRTADELVSILQEENDIVRIVDPVTRQVLYWPAVESGKLDCPCFECNSVWGRSERCANCSSLEALKLKQRMFKVELNNNRVFWVQSRPMNMDGTPCVLETVNDVTDGLLLEGGNHDVVSDLISNLNELIVTDALTSLYNRRFIDEFTHRLAQLAADRTPITIAMFDLDNMKEANDTYGHPAGDALLKDIAGFLRLRFEQHEPDRERHCVRFGGDEFIVIACGDDPASFEDEVRARYRQMRRVCYFEDKEIPISLSMGFASSNEFGWDWKALLKAADARMYSDKRSHENGQRRA